MNVRPRLCRALAAALGLLVLPALAQQARLAHLEGSLAFAAAGEREWSDRVPKRPLARGDRLWLDQGSRGELHLGPASVRLAGPVQMGIAAIDPRTVQLNVAQGSAQARLRELRSGDNFEFNTPNLTLRVVQAGMYRLDVDRARATTRVTVHAGTAVAYGRGGQALTLAAGQHVTFSGQLLAQPASQRLMPDSFDRWSLERDRLTTAALVQAQATVPSTAQPQRQAQPVKVVRRPPAQRLAKAQREAPRPQAKASREVRRAQGHAYVLGGPASAEHMAPADAQHQLQEGIPILRWR